MNKNRLVVPFVIVGGALIAWALRALVAAVPILPAQASIEARYVDAAFDGLFWIETAIYGLVMAFMIYCLIAFRAKDRSEQGERSDRSRGRLVETVWIAVSIMLTLGLAAFGAHELREVVGSPNADVDVEVRAQRFSWEFYYPKYQAYGAKLYLAKGLRHRIILTSKDVVHSFWVPEFRVKQDAVPGKVIHLMLTPTQTGDYRLLCSQLCGTEHTDMTADVEVVEPGELQKDVQGEF